jgi:hypothetical protein
VGIHEAILLKHDFSFTYLMAMPTFTVFVHQISFVFSENSPFLPLTKASIILLFLLPFFVFQSVKNNVPHQH